MEVIGFHSCDEEDDFVLVLRLLVVCLPEEDECFVVNLTLVEEDVGFALLDELQGLVDDEWCAEEEVVRLVELALVALMGAIDDDVLDCAGFDDELEVLVLEAVEELMLALVEVELVLGMLVVEDDCEGNFPSESGRDSIGSFVGSSSLPQFRSGRAWSRARIGGAAWGVLSSSRRCGKARPATMRFRMAKTPKFVFIVGPQRMYGWCDLGSEATTIDGCNEG
jgi:hypothetical protein